jgi:ParB family transcriptional regulator, chromosome partitioning protein
MKSRLGKGLDELFAENYLAEIDGESTIEIELSNVIPNPFQPRQHFDQLQLKELANSLKTHGLISPILVTTKDDRFVLVAGERRFRAAKIAGFVTIPAIIRDYTDEEMMEIALLENIQREDLTAMEIAKTYETMLHQLGLTQQQLALRLGKSRSQITNMVGLLGLPATVQEFINQGKLSMGHARALSKLQDRDHIEKLARQVVSEELSVRDVEELLKNKQKKSPITRTKKSPYQKQEEHLSKKLQAKVVIKPKQVIIKVNNEKELAQLLEKLDA